MIYASTATSHLKSLIFVIVVISLSSCSFIQFIKQSTILSTLGEISGKVLVDPKYSGNVHILLLEMDGGLLKISNHYSVGANGKYVFPVTLGTYYLAAYVDINNDEIYQPNEPASYLGINHTKPIKIYVNVNEKVIAADIRITQSIGNLVKKEIIPNNPLIIKNIGRVVSLDNKMFDRSNASIGLWRPVDFYQKIGGGLFFLEKYDDKKIPVLFIHGANGTALDWELIIKSMDRKKFQPWVLYYPSGFRLDLISDYLVKSINTIHNRHKVNDIYVVAHSMGGLVARSYIKKHSESKSTVKIALFMTINSPLNGMESAKSGVKNSPIVVQSWIDVAQDSEFIKKLHAWHLPKNIPYHLVFSFEAGKSGDGVVSLDSQLPAIMQNEAERLYGFNSNHTGVLEDREFIRQFNTILDNTLRKTNHAK